MSRSNIIVSATQKPVNWGESVKLSRKSRGGAQDGRDALKGKEFARLSSRFVV
ncbi:hypothetical protein [Aureimonas sp. AU4]|uniref:hypothetical protein n=1 Tax=Aureimonas sp. AU4 TaxID=1638163 RepID=UPI0012E39942|nr:hypothetical protein [Aureimonas sp. AU4]